jgi:hypothetical protein
MQGFKSFFCIASILCLLFFVFHLQNVITQITPIDHEFCSFYDYLPHSMGKTIALSLYSLKSAY